MFLAVGYTSREPAGDEAPVRVAVGAVYTVPSRAPLSGDLVVYGTPPDGWVPTLDDMGCQATAGGGPVVLADADRENRPVVDGTGLQPLVTFPGRPGHSIVCSGPAAQAAAPLHIAPGHDARHLVPLAAWSLAALLLPVGVACLLRPRDAPGRERPRRLKRT